MRVGHSQLDQSKGSAVPGLGVHGGYKPAAAVAAGVDFGKKTDRKVGRRWRVSILPAAAAAPGMDTAVALIAALVFGAVIVEVM